MASSTFTDGLLAATLATVKLEQMMLTHEGEWLLTGFDKRRAESQDLVGLAQRYVGHSIGHGDAIQLLLNIGVFCSRGFGCRLDKDIITLHAKLRLEE